MRNCLTINEALRIADFTGQEIRITLDSGKELCGFIERLWCSTCRLWVNPQSNNITKAIIANHAIRCIAFTPQSVVEDRSCRNSNSVQGIRNALTAACLTHQLVEIGINCNGRSKTIQGFVVRVNSTTFCFQPRESCNTFEECISDVEYVLFC